MWCYLVVSLDFCMARRLGESGSMDYVFGCGYVDVDDGCVEIILLYRKFESPVCFICRKPLLRVTYFV